MSFFSMPIGELDAIEATRFEKRVARESALNVAFEARRALRAALRSDLGEDVPSDDLRRRITRRLNVGTWGRRYSWRSVAASFLLGAVMAGTSFVVLKYQSDDLGGQVVSAHIRGLMAPQPTDLLSSDHHTVKPWFNGKMLSRPSSRISPLTAFRSSVQGSTSSGSSRLRLSSIATACI